MSSRPKTIPVVAGFLFAATAIAAVVGLSLLFPNRLMNRLWELNQLGAAVFRAMGKTAGMLLLALGAGTWVAATELLRGKRWAWWFAMTLFTLNVCGDAVSYLVTADALRSVAGVAVSGTFVYLLGQRKVRRWIASS